jgi:hypothetical protein
MSSEVSGIAKQEGETGLNNHQNKTGSTRAKQFKALIASAFAIAAISAGSAGAQTIQNASHHSLSGGQLNGKETRGTNGLRSMRAGATTTRKRVTPSQIMNSIVKIHDQNDWNEVFTKNYLNLRSATLHNGGYSLRGSCRKMASGLLPYSKAYIIKGDKETMLNCEGYPAQTVDVDRDRPKGFYEEQTNRLSNRIAKSVGVSSRNIGEAIVVKANRSVGVAKFRKLPAEALNSGSGIKSLKKLILRKNKKSIKIFYGSPIQAISEPRAASPMNASEKRKCVKNLLLYPGYMEGQVLWDRKRIKPRTALNGEGTAKCLGTAQRKVSIWFNMENNRHKMKRVTEVRTYDASPDFAFEQPQNPYDMFKRYTCERGKGKRQVRMVAKITVSFPEDKRRFTRKHRANGNKYDPWELGLTKPC